MLFITNLVSVDLHDVSQGLQSCDSRQELLLIPDSEDKLCCLQTWDIFENDSSLESEGVETMPLESHEWCMFFNKILVSI